jgi:hypothetical protein
MKNRKIRVSAAFVESKAGVFECRLPETFVVDNVLEQCHDKASEFGLGRADNRARRLKSLREHAAGQSPPEAHGAD